MTLHRAAAIVALALPLSACGGGGGGAVQTGAPTPPAPTPPAPPPVTISITGPGGASVNGIGSPTFNFSGSPPPVGTVFNLAGPAVRSTSNGVASAGLSTSDVQATFRGTTTVNGVVYPVFDFNIASLGVTAANVRGDGTEVTLAGGSKAGMVVATLNYTVLGAWTYTASGGAPVYLGQFATGSQTPSASLPTSGTATYTGSGATGGVIGGYFVPGGNNTIAGGTVTGDVSMNVNFATNGVSGQFTNMTAKPLSGGSVPWNNVNLNGNIMRSSGGSVSGSTTTSGAPGGAGANGFSAGASGSFASNFFGPAHNEIGGTWTLSESTADGGKTAFGTFAGTR